ncbi:Homoserine/homoserine lactone efflux protein [Roseibaca ekhonensis]|uniref:Homoserine/homoserine lactone efflux protein n=1 Tax=Roseinatronobacter ekhonensis TaxID=254356 RepID=A0A3B0MUE1_9RHOB|nr:LysE family translocator [Roseibaca ekhonensis]SUZ32424.1 Homoserine/homoserine lactone efflux protein [Roseibaca ekhonensis]
MELSLFAFALMAVVVVMTPGPTVLLALSNGSRFGVSRAGYGILGAAISDGVLIAAAALGLGAFLATSAVLFTVVKWLGVAYLVWLGVQMLHSSGKIGSVPAQTTGMGSGQPLPIFRKSFLVAVTNPKGYLFFTAFLPLFLTLSDPLIPQYLTLALIFIAVDVAVMVAYASLGSRAMLLLSDRGALWMDRTCGGTLIALGTALSLIRRSEV